MGGRRAFVERAVLDEIASGEGRLPEAVAHYLARVLRLEAGAEVELFDGEGRGVRGRFRPPSSVDDLVFVDEDPALPPLIVAQARVRGPKLDEVARRATELGASALWIFEGARSARGQVKGERISRITQDAARQSGRSTVPEIVELSFEALLARIAAFEGVPCAAVVGAELPLSAALAVPALAAGALVVIGPEGGLDPEEQRAAIAAGARPVSLGVHVLRTETASSAFLAAAQVALGRM